MTADQLERAVEFLLEHRSKFSVDMDQLKEAQKEAQKQHAADIADLREVQKRQAENLTGLSDTVAAVVAEMREHFNNLIIANEVTRDLAERVGQLAVTTSQRATNLEHKSNEKA
jgi:hypothetical protein